MRLIVFTLCVLFAAGAAATAASSPLEGGSGARSSLTVSVGAFEATGGSQRVPEAGLRLRRSTRGWLHLIGGGMVTSAGAAHVFLGLSIDVPVGRRVIFRGSFAPGYYLMGSGEKDLGHPIEFRSGLEVAVPLGGQRSIGIEFYHISNGGLGPSNPGAEGLSLTLTLPFGRRPGEAPRPAAAAPAATR